MGRASQQGTRSRQQLQAWASSPSATRKAQGQRCHSLMAHVVGDVAAAGQMAPGGLQEHGEGGLVEPMQRVTPARMAAQSGSAPGMQAHQGRQPSTTAALL